MRETTAAIARDWVTLALAGLGVSITPVHQYIGGLLLALACAGLASKALREQDERELWVIMLTGFLSAHIVLMVVETWFQDVPPQLPMSVAGFSSRFIARIAMRVLGLVEMRTDSLFDRFVNRILPDNQGDKK